MLVAAIVLSLKARHKWKQGDKRESHYEMVPGCAMSILLLIGNIVLAASVISYDG